MNPIASSVTLFVLAGLAEIGGGYLMWLWWRDGRAWPLGVAGGVAASNVQQSLQAASVEANNHLVVHDDHWNGHPPCTRDQFIASSRIFSDILRRKLEPIGRKNLFRRVTGLSG